MILRRLRICSKALPCEVRRCLDRYPPYNNMTTAIHGGESDSFPRVTLVRSGTVVAVVAYNPESSGLGLQ